MFGIGIDVKFYIHSIYYQGTKIKYYKDREMIERYMWSRTTEFSCKSMVVVGVLLLTSMCVTQVMPVR